jgi:hypothetical protein
MTLVPPQMFAELYIDMASYFFEKQIGQNSLYVDLGKRIKKTSLWRGNFVTLNYECLLEQSFHRVGINLSLGRVDLESDFNNNCFELIKPHGACNLYNSSLKSSPGMVIMDALSIQTSGEVLQAKTKSDFISHIKNNAFPPVMSYFQPDKATTSGTNFIEQHRARYLETIINADKVVIIGVLPRDNDRHVWEPLSKTKAQILYCSGNDGDRYKDWSANYPQRAADIVLELYFKDGFEQICNFAELEP